MAAPAVQTNLTPATPSAKPASGTTVTTSAAGASSSGSGSIVVLVTMRSGNTGTQTLTLSDSVGNTYTQGEFIPSGTASGAPMVGIFSCSIPSAAIVSGSTTWTIGNAVQVGAYDFQAYQLDSQVVDAGFSAGATGSSTAPAVTSATPSASGDYLWMAMHGVTAANAITDTIAATSVGGSTAGGTLNPTGTGTAGTSGGAASSNEQGKVGYLGLAASAAAQAFNGTISSAQWAAAIVAFKAAPAGTVTLVPRAVARAQRGIGKASRRAPALVPAAPPVPPVQIIAARQLAERVRALPVARGKQWSSATLPGLAPVNPPIVYSPLGSVSHRLLRTVARRSPLRASPPWDQTVIPTRPAGASRKSVWSVASRSWQAPPLPAQPLAAVRIPAKLGAPARLIIAALRGRRTLPVPPQILAPAPVFPTRQPMGRRYIPGARGKQWLSSTLSGLAPVTPPLVYSPFSAAARQLRRIGANRSRRAAVIFHQDGSRAKISPTRSKIAAARRGRTTSPIPAQVVAAAPSWVAQRIVPKRILAAVVKRRRSEAPVQTTVVTPPSYPPSKLRAARRLLSGSQRGRRTLPTPAQVAVPKWPLPNRRPAGRRVAVLIRGRRFLVPWPLSVFIPHTLLPTSVVLDAHTKDATLNPHTLDATLNAHTLDMALTDHRTDLTLDD